MAWKQAYVTYDPPQFMDEWGFFGRGRRRYIIAPPDRFGQPTPKEPQSAGWVPTPAEPPL